MSDDQLREAHAAPVMAIVVHYGLRVAEVLTNEAKILQGRETTSNGMPSKGDSLVEWARQKAAEQRGES